MMIVAVPHRVELQGVLVLAIYNPMKHQPLLISHRDNDPTSRLWVRVSVLRGGMSLKVERLCWNGLMSSEHLSQSL